MVRILTFVGLCAGTYVGVKALDNLVVWMAERRETNMDNIRLEVEAKQLKQQLLQEIQEKQATIPQEVLEKHHVQSDKNLQKHLKPLEKHHVQSVKNLHKHLKPQNEDEKAKLPRKHEVQQNNATLLSRDQEDRKPLKKEDKKVVSAQQQNCPGEVIAECLECGETFQIVEPVPHSPL